ncbi:Transcriptional regulator MntR [uncultured Sporomusa sp.]|uniref:Transcriptional regulator MntR n=1 Tax=uncultured Sporomusa sp. TaxID=307249 RepID=A0A212LTP6_9FIRM|nr:iron dependent repressor, metal binding and dimerization domain protein [uncultured Sporomusa sp.]SCM80877.1 Transcriptional regulator MntR [uncultured Sporomusa sp.]
MLSPSLEDYLEEIYRFHANLGVVRVTDISHKLNVSMPSVSKAMRKLNLLGYITYQKYGHICLTAKGIETGKFLVRRNQILQEFLVMLRTNCNIAAEAEAIEHYLSNSTIEAIQSFVVFMRKNPDTYQQLYTFLEERQSTDL